MDQIVGNQGVVHILVKILSYLDEKTLQNFGFVNKNFHENIQNPTVWFKKCKKSYILRKTENVWKFYINLSHEHENVDVLRSIARTLRKIYWLDIEYRRQTIQDPATPKKWRMLNFIRNRYFKSKNEKNIDFVADKSMLNIWKFLENKYPVLICPLNMAILADEEPLHQFIFETGGRFQQHPHYCLLQSVAWRVDINLIKDLETYSKRCMKSRQISKMRILAFAGLRAAILQQNDDNIKQFLQFCNDPNYETILNFATKQGRIEILRAMMPYIERHNIYDKFGRTPMHAAAYANNCSVLKLLHVYGFDVMVKDNFGRTPLHYAAYFGNKDAVEVLIFHLSACLDIPDNYGATPIFIATEKGFSEIVKSLTLTKNLLAANNDGHTPITKAKLKSHEEIPKFLMPYCKNDQFMNEILFELILYTAHQH